MSPHAPRILEAAAEFVEILNDSDPTLAQSLMEWIMGPLDAGEVDAMVTEGEHGPEYASRFPNSDLQIYWRVNRRDQTQILYVDYI